MTTELLGYLEENNNTTLNHIKREGCPKIEN